MFVVFFSKLSSTTYQFCSIINMSKFTDPPNINFDDNFETRSQQDPNEAELAELLDDLISLSEQGEISHTVKYLKKAMPQQLRTIKNKYERKQTEKTNKILSEILISQYSQLLLSKDLIGNAEDLADELSKDKLLRREIIRLLSIITPHIPLLGFVSGAIITGKHTAKHKFSDNNTTFTPPPPPPPSPKKPEHEVPKTE